MFKTMIYGPGTPITEYWRSNMSLTSEQFESLECRYLRGFVLGLPICEGALHINPATVVTV